MRRPWLALVCCCAIITPLASAQEGLKIIVIDGDEAANIVADKIAAEPIVEVRDGRNRRVAGAVVRFVVRRSVGNRLRAVFGNSDSEVRTLTDAAGRARAGSVTPVEPGMFEIEVQASHQGQTATTTIRHTNYATSAQAQTAGRKPAESSGSNAATQGAAAAGGGLSKLAIVGLAVGGAAGVGAAVVLSQKEADPPPGRVTGVTASTTSGVQAATIFTFSAQTVDFEQSSIQYHWEFGDGGSSTEPSPTHVYSSAGTYTVSVTVRDARQSARSETSVTVYTLTGTWLSTTGSQLFQLTQTSNAISGVGTIEALPGPVTYTNCAMAGSIESGTPTVVTLNVPPCRHPNFPLGGFLEPADFQLTLASDGRTLSGTRQAPVSGTVSVTFQRQ